VRGQVCRDLPGELALRLRVGREEIDKPAQTGNAQDELTRQVADMREAGDGHHVMLANALELDRASQHQLVVAVVVGEGRQHGRLLGRETGTADGRLVPHSSPPRSGRLREIPTTCP
jgi:hypothetical protein